jgi:hypothetical protein
VIQRTRQKEVGAEIFRFALSGIVLFAFLTFSVRWFEIRGYLTDVVSTFDISVDLRVHENGGNFLKEG